MPKNGPTCDQSGIQCGLGLDPYWNIKLTREQETPKRLSFC